LRAPLFPCTTLFRSGVAVGVGLAVDRGRLVLHTESDVVVGQRLPGELGDAAGGVGLAVLVGIGGVHEPLQRVRLAAGSQQVVGVDRKSTRLNSSHVK